MTAHPGQTRVVYKHFPLTSHGAAQIASEAAVCAQKQERFWEFHDSLFLIAPKFDREGVLKTAHAVVPDKDLFEQCIAVKCIRSFLSGSAWPAFHYRYRWYSDASR